MTKKRTTDNEVMTARSGQEHFVLSKLDGRTKATYKMLLEVCKEFCAATDREEE